MADVLSQSEIDALLGALTRGEVNADDMRENDPVVACVCYDFRRAMRFSKDHIRIISRIHEHFARLMTTHHRRSCEVLFKYKWNQSIKCRPGILSYPFLLSPYCKSWTSRR